MSKPKGKKNHGDFTAENVFDHCHPEPNTGCWIWDHGVDKKGYGIKRINYKAVKMHRLSYELFKGDPLGAHVLHKCDNPPCLNPDHLYLGDNETNIADKLQRGRQAKGEMFSHSKLTESDVLAIRKIGRSMRQIDIAAIYGVCRRQIGRVLNRADWRHI